MNTFPFIPGLTWRKAGFAFFSNSLSYRKVIESNPGWDITSEPPPGSILNAPKSSTMGGFSQTSLGNGPYNKNPLSYYPFNSWTDYVESLVRYSPSALKNVEENNGWSLTSDKVLYEENIG